MLLGCASNAQKQHEAEVLKTRQLDQQQHKLFIAYMHGDVSQAREAIQQSIQLYKASEKTLAPGGLGGVLYLEYFHLYVLEKRAGNSAATQIALIKARYWLTRCLEADHFPPDKIVEETKLDNAATIEDDVNRLDKGASGGKLPKYLEYLHQSAPSTAH